MDGMGNILWWLLILPVLVALISPVLPSARSALALVMVGVPLIALLALWAVITVFQAGPLLTVGGWLHLDALSAFHLAVLMVVFVMSSVFAGVYFRHEPPAHALDRHSARRFAALWYGAMAAMTLVLLSNNLGVMWVGVEATALLTAFLICLHLSPVSLEATWKYLIVCSVGVAFAFMGVLLVAASIGAVSATDTHLLHWTHLQAIAGNLDKNLMKVAFIFLLVGFGTKAGLAPMHSWLPDAHSQAPAPVSALFSGFMLNMALYAIMRFLPLVASATGGSGWASNLLIGFGLVSILVAAVFIVVQRDLKRFLAYCSVEHIGIIALGLGLGPLGAVAALFHTLNHSVCKALAFFSAGRLGQIYGTHDMRKIRASLQVNRAWGTGMLAGILILIGVAPFAIFMSEWFLIRAAVESQRYGVLGLFLAGAVIVFAGSLRHAVGMAWGPRPASVKSVPSPVLEWLMVVLPLLFLLVLGLWMPPGFRHILESASVILTGGGTP